VVGPISIRLYALDLGGGYVSLTAALAPWLTIQDPTAKQAFDYGPIVGRKMISRGDIVVIGGPRPRIEYTSQNCPDFFDGLFSLEFFC